MKQELRQEVFKKTSGCCWYCGEILAFNNMQVDHIIPQRNFKSHILHKDIWVPNFLKHLGINDVNNKDNLISSCRACNNFKSAFSLEQFREELSLQIERLNNNSTSYKRAKRFWLVEETGDKLVFYFEKCLSFNK